MDVLVLTNQYTPLGRVSWKRAICWVLSEKATVVEEYEDRFIHSPTQVFPMPSVIKFLTTVAGMFRKNIKFNRRNIWLRDKGRCGYCGDKVAQSSFTFDHIIPRSKEGKTSWENIVVCCHACNQKKDSRTPEQAKMKLLHKPVRPKGLPGAYMPIFHWEDTMPENWKSYLVSVMYWNQELESGAG